MDKVFGSKTPDSRRGSDSVYHPCIRNESLRDADLLTSHRTWKVSHYSLFTGPTSFFLIALSTSLLDIMYLSANCLPFFLKCKLQDDKDCVGSLTTLFFMA